jgi:hypothetical protein
MDEVCVFCDLIVDISSSSCEKGSRVTRGIQRILEISKLRKDEVHLKIGSKESIIVHESCRNQYTKRLKRDEDALSSGDDQPRKKVRTR